MTTFKVPIIVVNLIVSIIAILTALLLLEVGARVWLNTLASPDDHRRYALYSELDPSVFRWTSHHYLNYYPSPHYNKDGTYHNSLGYRNDEFPVQKPAGVYRIVALGGQQLTPKKSRIMPKRLRLIWKLFCTTNTAIKMCRLLMPAYRVSIRRSRSLIFSFGC